MSRVKGENWHKTLYGYLTRESPATRFELRQRTFEGSISIESFTIPEGWDDALLWSRVGDLVAQAQDDCNGSESGRCVYFIQCYDAQHEPVGRSQQVKFYSEKNAIDDTPGGGEIEGSNPKGLLAQMMRHTEGMVRMMQAVTQTQIQSMAQLNQQLLKEKQDVEDRRINLLVEMENLISERHTREMEEKREIQKQKRMDEIMGQVQRVMPALVARLLPGTAIGADASAQGLANAIKGLLEGLPDDRVQKILDALGPERGAALVEVMGLVQQIEQAPSLQQPANANGGNGHAAAAQ